MLYFTNIVRALTDESRTRLLMVLRGRELCVCQLTAFLDLSPSNTSRHLSILRQARLIESRKKGKWVYYALADSPDSPALVREALAWVIHSLESSPVILKDQRRIKEILEKEGRLLSSEDNDGDADSYHSLEIHSLEVSDEDDAQCDYPDEDSPEKDCLGGEEQ